MSEGHAMGNADDSDATTNRTAPAMPRFAQNTVGRDFAVGDTIADDVSTIECGLDDASANAPKLNCLIGTLWHRRSSVFIGVRYL